MNQPLEERVQQLEEVVAVLEEIVAGLIEDQQAPPEQLLEAQKQAFVNRIRERRKR